MINLHTHTHTALGLYSSADPATVHAHMEMLVSAGIGVMVITWYPPNTHDDNGPVVSILRSGQCSAVERVEV